MMCCVRAQAGMKKADYWDPTFEDMLTLIARLPRIAALIYRHVYRNSEITKLVRARARPARVFHECRAVKMVVVWYH